MERRCIYCGTKHDLSESDIIPDALTNARIYNGNVCKIEHNNKFSDLFESKVIEALSFITNELDIKSSKGKNFQKYKAIITFGGIDYKTTITNSYNIIENKYLKSEDGTVLLGPYEKMRKKSKDLEKIDINALPIEKRVIINSSIFFDISMYRLLSKIAFEWYCAENSVDDCYDDFHEIISFITTGKGNNPVSIIQKEEIYSIYNNQFDLGSHTLFAFETDNGAIEVFISLFGILRYRVVVAKKKPCFCKYNYLFAELRTDSSRKIIKHSSRKDAELYCEKELVSSVINNYVSENNKRIDFSLYFFLFELESFLIKRKNDTEIFNETVNKILLKQLNNIMQAFTIQKKSVKRFVKEVFNEKDKKIEINPNGTNRKYIIFLYVVYIIGLSNYDVLNDNILQKIVREKFIYDNNQIDCDEEYTNKLKNEILLNKEYQKILRKGAEKVENWKD